MYINILFVSQDDAFTCDMIGYSLETNLAEHPHIKTYNAQNEQDAYKVLNSSQVHLLVIDFDIKNMNCDRFVDLIKLDPQFKKIPMVIISEDKFIERKAFELGVVDFFKKPLSIESLLDKIFSTLSPFHEVNRMIKDHDIETTQELVTLIKKNIKYSTFIKNELENDINKINTDKLIELCNSILKTDQKILNHINDIQNS